MPTKWSTFKVSLIKPLFCCHEIMRLDGSIQQIILLLRLLMRQNQLDGSLIPKLLLYAITKYCLQGRILNYYRSLIIWCPMTCILRKKIFKVMETFYLMVPNRMQKHVTAQARITPMKSSPLSLCLSLSLFLFLSLFCLHSKKN